MLQNIPLIKMAPIQPAVDWPAINPKVNWPPWCRVAKRWTSTTCARTSTPPVEDLAWSASLKSRVSRGLLCKKLRKFWSSTHDDQVVQLMMAVDSVDDHFTLMMFLTAGGSYCHILNGNSWDRREKRPRRISRSRPGRAPSMRFFFCTHMYIYI